MRVVIIGAGIAGLALAQRLDAQGNEVTVLERSNGPRQQGYMIDFFGPGYDAAEAMGVLPRMNELGYRLAEAAWYDANGRRRATLDLGVFSAKIDGRMMSIMRPDIERALREHLPKRVDVRYGTSFEDLDDLDADLVVGADGIHSTVRHRTFGGDDSDYLRHLGFHTAAFIFDDPEIHAAVQGKFCLTDTVDRQVGLYAMRDGRVAAFTVHRSDDPNLPEDPREALRREFAGLGWLVPRTLEKCPPSNEIYYDVVAQTVLPKWSKGRVALVGDACYAVSLVAGQGASLAISGAYVLADQLARHDTVADALTGYEQVWRPVAEEKQEAGRKGVRWFLPRSRFDVWTRRTMMKVSRLPGMDHLIVGAFTGKVVTVVRDLEATAGSRRGMLAG